jgi:hypothetical protein
MRTLEDRSGVVRNWVNRLSKMSVRIDCATQRSAKVPVALRHLPFASCLFPSRLPALGARTSWLFAPSLAAVFADPLRAGGGGSDELLRVVELNFGDRLGEGFTLEGDVAP